MERANIVIVGGGVVGCAIAMRASATWSDVFLLEALPKLGMGSSTRNSGVIHSGLYYTPGSLKARHCLAGNPMLYRFAAARGVPHRRTGKLVVATSSAEVADLEPLMANGRENGVEGLRIVDGARIRELEPQVAGVAAIEVPSTGIVMAEELVKACARIAAGQGASLVVNARVEQIEPVAGGLRVASAAGDIETRCVVNSAGLFADDVAAMVGYRRHRIYPVRGEYAELVRAKSHLLRGLVYPLPRRDGLSLGIHLTRTLWDTVLVGPTARYIADKNDYERGREPVENFVGYARHLLPELAPGDLTLSYSGIRSKLLPPGASGHPDWVIEHDPAVPGVIHLIGMESPGLTSALSIADQVAGMIRETLG
ncbi:MAG TPA: NAD(P)/FAD-dependent oxidoreductase [Candidatus Acidoferrales bacterium]|nr:NAD(P)/FAD-dependent oxidoreductase [Candidatus Acidoferrales bacterium]